LAHMFGRLVFLIVLFCIVFAAEEANSQVNFEGTYVLSDGSSLYLCQTGTDIQGSYSELGLIRGSSSDGQTLKGTYWIAGVGNCVVGDITFALTDFGLTGSSNCDGDSSVKQQLSANRVDSFRPSDLACGLISTSGNTLEGFWENSDNLPLNLCFTNPTNADSDTVKASLQRVDHDGVTVNWYLTGQWLDSGRIFLGTYYQDLAAGAVLFWLSNTDEVNYYWWTGLIHDSGDTFIDLNQLNNPYKHGVESYQLPPGNDAAHTTNFASCSSFDILQTFVLANLPIDNDNYYYFVSTEYLENIVNIRPTSQLDNTSNAVVISLSFLLVLIVLLVL